MRGRTAGKVKDLRLARDEQGRPKGFAHVDFLDLESATAAVLGFTYATEVGALQFFSRDRFPEKTMALESEPSFSYMYVDTAECFQVR